MSVGSVTSLAVVVLMLAPVYRLILTGRYRPFGVVGSSAELAVGIFFTAIFVYELIDHRNANSTGQFIAGGVWAATFIGLGFFGLRSRSDRRGSPSRRR